MKINRYQGSRRYGPGLCATVLVAASLMVCACNFEDAAEPSAVADTLVLTEALRIGDEAAGDSVFFGGVYEIGVDSRGRILVTDDDMYGFFVFERDGTLLHEVGSEGDGPGEYPAIPDLLVGPLDSVYVFDDDNYRLSVYSPDDYALAYTLRLSRDDVFGAEPIDILAVTSESLVIQYEHIKPMESEQYPNGLLEIKHLDWSGQIVRDSIALIPAAEVTMITVDFGTIALGRQFGRKSFVAAGSDGFMYFGWNEDIGIRAVTSDGSMAHEFNVPHASVSVTSSEKDAIEEAFLNLGDQIRRDMPDTKPGYNAMVPDDEGRLWFQLSWAEGASETDWIVVEGQTGDVVAKATLRTNLNIKAVRHGHAYSTLDVSEAVITVWEIGQ